MKGMDEAHRYLVISELFLPTKGGTAVWFDEVYRRLGGKGVHVVTADVPGAAEHDRRHPNTVHRLKLERHPFLRPESLAMYLKLFARSLALALRHRFDAVHAGRVLPEGLVGWGVARLTRRPLVVYAHGEEITTWRQPLKARALRFTYRHADRVVANSEFTREELVRLGVREERVAVIYPGVDLERFRPGLETEDLRRAIGLEPPERLILSVGRLSRRKGFDQVIRALPRLLERGVAVRVGVIGIGEDERHLARLAGELGVADRVHLLGHVPMEDLPRWYNAADVFAMPNRDIDGDTEGFGMVFVEASACGTPVVGGRAGGTGSAIADGVTGFRVEGADLDEITEALARLCADAALAREMGQAGARRARVTFAWERVAAETAALGRDLGGRRGTSPPERAHGVDG